MIVINNSMQTRKKTKTVIKTKTRKNNILHGGANPILDVLEKLLTIDDRKLTPKQITYKNPLINKEVTWPETNNALKKIKNTYIQSYITSFNVSEVYTLLTDEKQYFFNTIYLPELSKMKSKQTGNPTYFTSNQPHREFGKNQTNKPGQYFTEDKQISMKAETFHDRNVEELWAWYVNKSEKLNELTSNGTPMLDAMNSFPLKYKDDLNARDIAIIDIVKPTFINCISRIINSYIKYGKKTFKGGNSTDLNYNDELKLLDTFLNNLNKLYMADEPKYAMLFNVVYSYFRWYSQRHIDHEKKYLMERFTIEDNESMVNRALANGIFVLPASLGTNFYKTIKSYCIPVITTSMVNAMGHYMFLTPHTNFIHDILHLITISKRKALLPLYETIKPFFLGYEKMHKELGDTDFRNIFDYILFGILHEDAGIMYYEDAEFNTVFDIQKCNIFGKPLSMYLKQKDPKPINELSIFTYLQLLAITIKIMCCCIDNDVFDSHITKLYDNNKRIPYKLANLNREINTTHVVDFVKKDGDTYKILGNQSHVNYIKMEDFKASIKQIDELLTTTGVYGIYFHSIKQKNNDINHTVNKSKQNNRLDQIMTLLKSVEKMEDSMMNEMLPK